MGKVFPVASGLDFEKGVAVMVKIYSQISMNYTIYDDKFNKSSEAHCKFRKMTPGCFLRSLR